MFLCEIHIHEVRHILIHLDETSKAKHLVEMFEVVKSNVYVSSHRFRFFFIILGLCSVTSF
eukprot:UN00105